MAIFNERLADMTDDALRKAIWLEPDDWERTRQERIDLRRDIDNALCAERSVDGDRHQPFRL